MKKSVLPQLASSLVHLCAKPHPYHNVNNPSRQKLCSLAMPQLLHRVVAILVLAFVGREVWAENYIISYTNNGTTYYMAEDNNNKVVAKTKFDETCIWTCYAFDNGYVTETELSKNQVNAFRNFSTNNFLLSDFTTSPQSLSVSWIKEGDDNSPLICKVQSYGYTMNNYIHYASEKFSLSTTRKNSFIESVLQPESLSIVSPNPLTIYVDNPTSIEYSILPNGAYNNVTLSSANTNLVTVNGDKITGKTAGTTTITVTANKKYQTSGITQTITVNVRYKVDNPVISFSPSSNDEGLTGTATITSTTAGAKIYYTKDGSEPNIHSTLYSSSFSINRNDVVKAIAIKEEEYWDSSDIITNIYNGSGSVGGKVILNDFEDHTWTYYAGADTNVDGGYYKETNTTGTKSRYKGKIYNPNPRNVKITYKANGGAVSINESENEFIYFETIEQIDGKYTYQVISNPFSKRPTGKGFGGWKITGGATYIKNKNENGVLSLDEEIEFENLPYSSVNCTSAEIELTATWVDATIKYGQKNVSSEDFKNGTYETNLLVIQSSNTQSQNLNPKYPVTIMMVEPDGSKDYRNNTFYGNIQPQSNSASYMMKVEYMNYNAVDYINARGYNLIIGRGMQTNYKKGLYITGTENDRAINQVLKIESGKYTSFYNFNVDLTAGNLTKQWVTFGNDYDRAKGDNNKLEFTGAMYVSNDKDVNATSGKEVCRVYSKSGKFTSSATNAGSGAAGDGCYYFGFSNKEEDEGYKYLEIQGGEWWNISGGMGTGNSTGDPCTTIRMRGGLVKGCIYGAAQYAGAAGTRLLVFTGGTIKGWIAGGANGTQSSGGLLTGSSYVYVGGNTRVDSNGSTTLINRGTPGNVFGAGCGWTATSDAGKVSEGTNVVVADNAYVERGVYGGGSFGYCATDKNSYLYITGGHVEGKAGGVNTGTNSASYTTDIKGGVYGGASKNKGGTVKLYMTGGLVEGGIYGGSNASGALSGSVTVQINGGQVGTDATHTANVHGGGYGQLTLVNGDVDVTLGKENATEGATIYGDVYGGSALGQVNATGTVNNNALSNVQYHSGKKTNVTLNAGTINGSLYGGALGQKNGVNGATSDIAANVYGPVQVTVNGGSVKGENSAVYGCNNVNGAPQSTVKVDVYKTDAHNAGSDEDDPADDIYAINAVYGGGNQANYTYTATGQVYPQVTVHNCDNSIKFVYGGGNQATVPGTKVDIYGGNIIGNVFGGGNNADVTTNGTDVNIYGGTILNVYGGNNNGGAITGTINVDVAESKETESSTLCPVNVTDLYGGGNKAASNAGKITIGKCSNISNVYGGANQANVTGDITLNIVDGHIGNVFGGNNNSGNITGAITVNVNWGTEVTAENASLGNVYGGGNLAPYSIYGYDTNGTPKTSGENPSDSPTVNVWNATTTGSVFGGGKGTTAIMYGNPIVNIGDWATKDDVIIGGDVFGGGDLAAVEGNPIVTIRECGTIIEGDLYGGGNAAPVFSTNTTVWGGHILGNVFGGGNGSDATKNPKGAQVGYKSDDSTAGTGDGNAVLNIYGGTIGIWETVDGQEQCTSGGGIFGGSNTNGNIRGKVMLTVDQRAEDDADDCTPLKIKELYGSGNEAAYTGTGIDFTLGCISSLKEIYGGAKAADLNGNVVLTISSGHFNKVYGGNNVSGKLNGTITVNIDETGCHPVVIDELYAGGNMAPYSVYGYEEALDTNGRPVPKTTGTAKASPTVNVISCTKIGQVFGGGYGAPAVLVGSPTVNINEIYGRYSKDYDGLPNSEGNYTNDGTEDRLGVIGDVFGGGNAANVVGDTHVNIATKESESHLINWETPTATPASGVPGANITGNVYGGGNQADVTGKTNVTVGKKN